MRSREELSAEALAIFRAGLAAVDPYQAVRDHLALEGEELVLGAPGAERERIDLAGVGRLLVVGAGKASARMAQALEELLGERIDAGRITVKYGHTAPLERVELVEAGHPVPDEAGARAVQRQLELVSDLGPEDLVLAVISGGGSALLPLPAPGISLAEKQTLTGALLAAGADIHAVNTVRKHISAVKGGQLARHVAPARLVSLVLSDVVGDDLDVIASGPTVPDRSSFAAAREVLERFELWEGAPASVREQVARGLSGEVPENPAPGDPVFERSRTLVVASSRRALEACRAEAEARGWETLVLTSRLQGEAREVARVLAALALELRAGEGPLALPACLLTGGETTVTLRGDGKGGRNQELALAACLDLAGSEGLVLFSGGTDGNDGPTDAAGGMAFGDSLERARAAGADLPGALARNDAYHLLDSLGDLVRTGPSGTNVMDLQVILVDRAG